MEYMKRRYGVTEEALKQFLAEWRQQGCGNDKIRKIRRHIFSLYEALPEDRVVTKERLSAWRQRLLECGLSPRTVEVYVTDVNALLKWAGHRELRFTQGCAAELTGRRFGRLTAVEPLAERIPGQRSVLWRCRCDCGKEIKAQANQLLRGNYQSCGCRKAEVLMESNLYVDNTNLRMVLSDTVRKDNTSGYTGVFRKRDKWSARIRYKGKIYSLGCYYRVEDAVRARKNAEAWVKDDAERLLTRINSSERTDCSVYDAEVDR